MDLVNYPSVELGGKTFTLKYRYKDMKLLADEHKIDLFEVPAFSEKIDEKFVPLRGLALMDRVIKLLAYGAQISVEEAAEVITVRDMPDAINAIRQAVVKASPQATATEKAAPGLPSQIQ
jgi:hypothetical protein